MSSSTEAKKSAPPTPPPIGSPCWVEIMSSDPPKLKEFYAALFPGWKFPEKKKDDPEGVVHYTFEQPSGLSGGIIKLPEGMPKPGEQPMGIGYTVYFYVESIEEIEKNIVELGGVKVLGKTAERQFGWFANFKDPEGNRFGTYETNWAAFGDKE